MYVLIDETGKFESNKSGDFSIVTLVTITDSESKKFLEFVEARGIKDKKGKGLSADERKAVLKYIGSKQEIRYISCLFDSSSGNNMSDHKKKQVGMYDNAINNRSSKLSRKELSSMKVARGMINNLSPADYLKVFMTTLTYTHWLYAFLFDWVHINNGNDSWLVKHRIDTQNCPDRFSEILGRHLASLQTREGFNIFFPKVWEGGHTLINNYEDGAGPGMFNVSKFFSDITITNEQVEPLLLLPDIIGNTIFRSINSSKDMNWRKTLKLIMPNRSLTMKLRDERGYYLIAGAYDSTSAKIDPKLLEHHHLMLET